MLLKSDKACEDIDNIWLYIAFDNVAAADKLIFDIDDKFHSWNKIHLSVELPKT